MTAFKAQLPFDKCLPLKWTAYSWVRLTVSLVWPRAWPACIRRTPIEAARSDMIVVHQAEIQSALAKMSFDACPALRG